MSDGRLLAAPIRAGGGHTTAPFGRRLLRVVAVDDLGAYRVLRIADPDGPEPEPGQFAMLAAAERWGGGEDERPYLARAFSFARWRDGEAHYLLEDVGPGTKLLCELRAGEGVWVLGPLGRGFAAPGDGRRALLVGGGVGIAPLAIWQDALKREATLSGEPPPASTVLLGFRDGPRARGAELFSGARVATDDGSVGHHGFVTDLLAAELEKDAHATMYACGPPRMLEAVRTIGAGGLSRRGPTRAGDSPGRAWIGAADHERDGFDRGRDR